MAFDPSTLTDYAWSDIAKAAKAAMVNAAVGGSTLSVNGRQIGRITIEEATKLYQTATEMAAIESGNGGAGPGDVLVRFNETS